MFDDRPGSEQPISGVGRETVRVARNEEVPLLAREGSYSVGTTARGRRSVDEGEKEGGDGGEDEGPSRRAADRPWQTAVKEVGEAKRK